MAFSAQNTAILAGIQTSDIEETFTSSKRFHVSGRWLAVQNSYAGDATKKITTNNLAGLPQNPRQLAQYIAASSVLHCSDGWSFLGRSVNAMLNGDPGTALHLAYYAELRAAMSLLATQGIGAFKNRHYWINAANSVSAFPTGSGTHDFVWDCLDTWSATPSAANLLGGVVSPYGIPLTSWVSPLGQGSIIRPSAQKWLRQWGMDLSNMSEDKIARNTASYRPSGMKPTGSSEAIQATEFVRSLWENLEPTTLSGFGNLDKFLLRSLVDKLAVSRFGSGAILGPQHRQIVNQIVNYQALGERISSEYTEFLLREKLEEDPQLLLHARVAPKRGPNWHLSVISRSVLLLRVATGATQNLCRQSGIEADDLNFWRNELGKQKGLWKAGAIPEPIDDIWADVDDNIGEFEDFEAGGEAERSYFDLTKNYGTSVLELGKLERISVLNL